jgi:hypothetical protein
LQLSFCSLSLLTGLQVLHTRRMNVRIIELTTTGIAAFAAQFLVVATILI